MTEATVNTVHIIGACARQLAQDSNAVTMIGLALLLVITPVLLITLSDLPWKPAKKRERHFIERF